MSEMSGLTTCRKCGHWHGGVGTEPGNPCTHYVESLKAECGCTGVQTPCPLCGSSSRIHPVGAEACDRFEWRPIETAPRGTYVLIGWFELPGQKSYATAMFHSTNNCWCNTWMAFAKDSNPTHWMPLPEPPK